MLTQMFLDHGVVAAAFLAVERGAAEYFRDEAGDEICGWAASMRAKRGASSGSSATRSVEDIRQVFEGGHSAGPFVQTRYFLVAQGSLAPHGGGLLIVAHLIICPT